MVAQIGNIGLAKRALLRRLGDVDIRLLRIFVAVTECGGFAASELELNIGRSTISKHIADLELRIGLKLCNRGPAGFSLTPEGDQVLQSAQRLLSSIDGFQSEVDDIHQNLTGTLRIGLFDQSTTNPKAHLHDAIGLFDQSAPDVQLEIALDPPNVLEARVVEGTLDIGIVPIHRQSASLNYQFLYDEHMTLYCGEGHALFDESHRVQTTQLDLSAYKYAGVWFQFPKHESRSGPWSATRSARTGRRGPFPVDPIRMLHRISCRSCCRNFPLKRQSQTNFAGSNRICFAICCNQ